jgi:hypothetical protein
MCNIIYSPKGIISKHTQDIMDSNPDGFGIVNLSTGKVKRSLDYALAWDQLYECKKNGEGYIIHFRWCSAGIVSKSNCHPFSVPGGGLLMHNGHSEAWNMCGVRPDTYHIAQAIGMCPKYRKSILNSIYGKFAFIKKGSVEFYGKWEKLDGLTFANLNFLPYGRLDYSDPMAQGKGKKGKARKSAFDWDSMTDDEWNSARDASTRTPGASLWDDVYDLTEQ